MKTIARNIFFSILTMLALTCTLLLAQKQTPSQLGKANPPPLKSSRVLMDFRVQQPIDSAKIAPATERFVLSKLFRRYLRDADKCNSQFGASGSNDPLEAARKAGQIVPAIADSASGSFTAPGKSETAYVISVSECNASHADNFGTKRVAIFSDQQLIANVDVEFRTNIVRKTDLNGDGIDELLMTTGDMNQGVVIETAALLSFQNGRIHVIQDLGTVTEDSCASLMAGSSSKASVVSVSSATPGRMPTLRTDNYEASCRKAKRWRFLSTGKMQ